jgi:hypothetical protein
MDIKLESKESLNSQSEESKEEILNKDIDAYFNQRKERRYQNINRVLCLSADKIGKSKK